MVSFFKFRLINMFIIKYTTSKLLKNITSEWTQKILKVFINGNFLFLQFISLVGYL